MARKLLTITAAAAMLGIPTSRIRKLVDAGELPHVDLPDVGLRFLEEDLREWIRAHRSPATEGPEET